MVKNYSKNKDLKGLYDPSFEHDACGVAMIANIKGVKNHDIIKKGLEALEHLGCLLYTSPSPRDKRQSRMPSSA